MNQRTKKITLAASAAALVAALAVAVPQLSHAKQGSQKNPTQKQLAASVLSNDLLTKGEEAVRKGNYASAESAFQALVDLDPEDHATSIHLARLYDLQGRDKAALEAYRRVVAPYNGVSSLQSDPRVLARYGDLLAKYGKKEAVSAYLVAAEAGEREPGPRATLSVLKSAAHLAAGERDLAEGKAADAEKHMLLATAASPAAWEAQYYMAVARSQLGDSEGASVAMTVAEKRAPARDLRQLRHRRALLGIGQNSTIAVIEIRGKTAKLTEVPSTTVTKPFSP